MHSSHDPRNKDGWVQWHCIADVVNVPFRAVAWHAAVSLAHVHLPLDGHHPNSPGHMDVQDSHESNVDGCACAHKQPVVLVTQLLQEPV